VRVTSVDLQPGTYTGAITISSSAQNSPLTIPVTLTVTVSPSAVVSPSALNFEFIPGAIFVNTQLVNVTAGGGIAVPFSATVATRDGGSWISVNKTSGQTPDTLAISVNPVGLAPGQYSGEVRVQPGFNVSPTVIPVVVNVATSGPQLSAVVSGASFRPGPIVPGEIVTLYGTGMGQSGLTTYRLTPSGAIDTLLSNVRVWFDDQPAPLLFVSATEIGAIVPYAVAARQVTRVSVEYAGVRSSPREIAVTASAPSLFTVGGSAQGAILNQDGSLNGLQNGAQPGTIVVLYATGEGLTIPGGIDGMIVPSNALARPVLPVSVTVGGRPAEVVYAGSAPGQVAGLMQVNARLAADTPVGAQQVLLTVGNASSQSGVTLSVRQ
jgi:uncharacterized protein (TIGR03437 family)